MKMWLAQLRGELLLGWRRATRGARFFLLLAVVTALMVVLPWGAAEPLATTGYAMAFAWMLLLLCSLWSGVASYAYDRECHRMALVFTKPVRVWTLWVGRWLGTTLPFVIVLITLALFALQAPFPEGRKIALPLLPDIHTVAQTELQAMVQEGMDLHRIKVEQGVSEERLLVDVIRHIQQRYTELEPHKPLSYTFAPLPKEVKQVTFCLTGTPLLGAYDEAMLSVTIQSGTQSYTCEPRVTINGFEVDFPSQWQASGEPITLTLNRRSSFNQAGFIMFREREDVQLRYDGYSPMMNVMCATVVLFGVLAMASALGCALGSLFSLPVALFVGTLALLAAGVSAMESNFTVTEELESFVFAIGARASELVAGPFQGILHLNPLNRLQAGEAILWNEIGGFMLKTLLPWVLACSCLPWMSRLKDEDR